MSKQHNDEYWMKQINACRTSGLTDYQWCRQNGISPSTFYYHVKILREKTCAIPSPAKSESVNKQEVVQIFDSSMPELSSLPSAVHESHSHNPEMSLNESVPAVQIFYRGIQMNITNHADASIVAVAIQILQNLC